MTRIIATIDLSSRGQPSNSSFSLPVKVDTSLIDETRDIYVKTVMMSYVSDLTYPLDVRPVVQSSLVDGVYVSDGSQRQILIRSPTTSTVAGNRVYIYNTDMVVKSNIQSLLSNKISFEIDRSDGLGIYQMSDYVDFIVQIFQ